MLKIGTNKIICGDTLTELKKMPDEFVDTIITSPPYFGLRDYSIKGQIGLEKTLEEYIAKLLATTKELQRVLKPTGVMFWNHGDSYGGSGMGLSYAGHTKGPRSILPDKTLRAMPKVAYPTENIPGTGEAYKGFV